MNALFCIWLFLEFLRDDNGNMGCVTWVCIHIKIKGAQFELYIHSKDKDGCI